SQYISASTVPSHLESVRILTIESLNSFITPLEQCPLTDETLNYSILELEHQFLTQSMLNCCNQLNNWTIMSKHIFIDNTTFYILWSNANQL
ncbi:unnamed protein product, partial [Rotaria sordida]